MISNQTISIVYLLRFLWFLWTLHRWLFFNSILFTITVHLSTLTAFLFLRLWYGSSFITLWSFFFVIVLIVHIFISLIVLSSISVHHWDILFLAFFIIFWLITLVIILILFIIFFDIRHVFITWSFLTLVIIFSWLLFFLIITSVGFSIFLIFII